MKKLSLLCGLAVLAGCAASGQGGIGLNLLETETYLRADRGVPRSFVQIQKAIFQHQAACGSNIKFAVDENHPSYARVTKELEPAAAQGDAGWSRTLVLGLQQIEDKPTRGRLYSYYAPDKSQIQEMYNAILHPEVCRGMPIPPEPPKPEEPDE